MKKKQSSIIIVKRKDAKPVDPNAKPALGVCNPPWDKIKHLASKKPVRRPSR